MTMQGSTPTPRPDWLWHVGLVGFVAVWWLVYRQMIPASDWLTALVPVDRHSHAGEAIAFFFYNVPKVMLLLTLIVFGMGVVRSFFSPERTRVLLAGKREGVGNLLGAADLITRVAGETGKAVQIEKIEDMRQIVGYGVMSTPAVMVGGKVVHKGSVPSREQVLSWLGWGICHA